MIINSSYSKITPGFLTDDFEWCVSYSSPVLNNIDCSHNQSYVLTFSNIVSSFLKNKFSNTNLLSIETLTKNKKFVNGWVDNAKILNQEEFVKRLRDNLLR